MQVEFKGHCDYEATYAAMRRFTESRDAGTDDALWLCEHPPVFTQGIAGKAEHVLRRSDIPVIATNRGGQVTYHGPGQVVAYPLLDLQRLRLHAKTYVYQLELAVLRVLESYGLTGHRVPGAPGVYVRLDDPRGHARLPRPQADSTPLASLRGLGKVAALGVKVTRQGSYHGLALNVAMDLSPFEQINPCGYQGLRTVDLATLGVQTTWGEAATRLAERLQQQLSPASQPSEG